MDTLMILAFTMEQLLEYEGLIMGILVAGAALVGMVAQLFGKRKLRKQADQAGADLAEAHRNLVDLSHAASAIILGVENARDNLPNLHKKKLVNKIMEVTEDRGLEPMVNPLVKGVTEAGSLLSDLEKLLPSRKIES